MQGLVSVKFRVRENAGVIQVNRQWTNAIIPSVWTQISIGVMRPVNEPTRQMRVEVGNQVWESIRSRMVSPSAMQTASQGIQL